MILVSLRPTCKSETRVLFRFAELNGWKQRQRQKKRTIKKDKEAQKGNREVELQRDLGFYLLRRKCTSRRKREEESRRGRKEGETRRKKRGVRVDDERFGHLRSDPYISKTDIIARAYKRPFLIRHWYCTVLMIDIYTVIIAIYQLFILCSEQ